MMTNNNTNKISSSVDIRILARDCQNAELITWDHWVHALREALGFNGGKMDDFDKSCPNWDNYKDRLEKYWDAWQGDCECYWLKIRSGVVELYQLCDKIKDRIETGVYTEEDDWSVLDDDLEAMVKDRNAKF